MALSSCLLILAIHAVSGRIIGVPFEKLSFYDDSKDFSCLDGSQSIPFSYVNDDYCDCTDGSDEPGTAACSNSKFYCENKQHEPRYLVSSRVNDNICDCCDGSDEWNSETTCENTCIELGRKVQEEIRKLREIEEAGHQKKSEYIANGHQKKEEYERELGQVESDLGVVSSEVESLRQAKEEAEEPESKMKEEHQKKWEEEKSLRGEEKRRNDALNTFNMLDTNGDQQINVEELMAKVELDDDGDNMVSEEEAETYLDGNQPIGFEDFLEKSWDLVSSKLKEKRDREREDREQNEEKEEEEHDDDDDDDDDDNIEEEETLEMPPYDEETQRLIEIADNARKSFKDAEERKKNLESRKSDLEKYLNIGLGPNHEFSPLFEQCYEYTDREYTYKLCMFQKVTQRSKNGGRETSLGNWDKWNGQGEDLHSVMRYGNGERCWNGPDRSTLVYLKCGVEDKLISASEPNKCEYAMEFVTPAMCEGKTKKKPTNIRVEL